MHFKLLVLMSILSRYLKYQTFMASYFSLTIFLGAIIFHKTYSIFFRKAYILSALIASTLVCISKLFSASFLYYRVFACNCDLLNDHKITRNKSLALS